MLAREQKLLEEQAYVSACNLQLGGARVCGSGEFTHLVDSIYYGMLAAVGNDTEQCIARCWGINTRLGAPVRVGQ